MTIIAKQFGFTNNLGSIGNIADGDFDTFWAPLPTNFSAYSDYFFVGDPAARVLNYGASFPALEFDLGEAKRLVQMYLQVETALTLGPAVLIGSDVGATSPADTLQSADIFLAEYRQDQIISNRYLEIEVMKNADIRRRFLRLLQRSSDPADVAPTPGPTNSVTFDRGLNSWVILPYTSEFTVEVWGAGASGGVSANAQNGGATNANKMGSWSLDANGGNKASATVPNSGTGAGTGGTASGGNVANTTGGTGGTPSPATSAEGYSGKGGDAPSGGLGGDAVFLAVSSTAQFLYGNPGRGPGGGGSGRALWYPPVPTVAKYPSGGSGGYSKSVFARSSGLADPGSLLECTVGDGGVSSQGDGQGAQGRVRYSWT